MNSMTINKTKFNIVFVIITICFFGVFMTNAQTPNSTCIVDVSKPGVEVAPICRGQQIEEFNHQIQGGLYAQLINNPSFEGKHPV